MTINIDYEYEKRLDIDYKEIITNVVLKALEVEGCPYDIELNVILMDNEGIKEINKTYRRKNVSTDVLSFPMIEFDIPGDFSIIEKEIEGSFNPETNELVLGDIIISHEKAVGQAMEYGHSLERELAFLVAHSMMHLFGYDHMEDSERLIMERKQENILKELKIGR